MSKKTKAAQAIQPRPPIRQNSRILLLSVLAIVISCLIAYFPALHSDFVMVDDHEHIFNNTHLLPISWDSISYFWLHPYQSLYIPVSYNVFALLATVSQSLYFHGCSALSAKFNPYVFHAANLILHIANTLLVLSILRRWSKNEIASLAGALLFALHPLQVESVAWVSELRGLLASFLGLFSVIVFLKRPDKISARYYLYQVGVLLLFGLSLLAKPSTAPLPAIALLIDYLISKRSLKRLAIEIAPMVLLSIVIIIVTTKAQPMDQISFFDRPRVIGDALAFYLFKFAGPFHLGIDYGRSPQLTLNNSITYFDWIIPAGALASAFFLRRKALWLLTAALISLASIAPVSGIVTFAFQGFSTVADRYVYLAMIGPALALTAILSSARFRSGYASKVAFAVIFLLGIISFAQCKVWKNTDTLMSQAISVDPNSSMALNYFATKLFDKGDYQSSLQKLKLAIQVYPGYPPAHFNAGVAEGAIGDQTDAINEYLTAIRLDSQHADPYINLGNIYADQGRFVDACTMYAQADKIDTKTSNLHFNWGVALAKSGYDYEAFYHFQKEIEYNPSFPKSYINAGYIDAKQNKMPEAAEMFAKAVSIDPTQPPWWTDLAVINDRLGKRDEAASDIQKALAIDPQFAPALSMQSKLLQEQSKR